MKIQHFMALVVLSLATVPGARAAVLAGPITNAANGHAYYLLSANTWMASEAEAQGLGGHLVTINDAAENQWVVSTFYLLTGFINTFWIGLNDAANQGQFVWASGEPVTYTNWYPGGPSNVSGEDYGAMFYSVFAPLNGIWNVILNPTPLTFGVVEVSPPLPPLPAAVTQPADRFMPDGARLNGLANPRGSPTLAWFEWGTSIVYGNATPPQSIGSDGNAVGFSNALVGLVSGTEYHFRARASNAFGFVAGLDQTFYLGVQQPAVTTLAADQNTNTSARLRGQVNPRGWPTAAWFEWGTDTNYGNLIGMQDVGQGSSVSNVNVVLDGLTIGPTYHYRLVASNAFGTVYGADQTFNVGLRAAVRAGPFINAANGHAYYLLNPSTWTASEAEARWLGGHLVTINDAAENEWVLNTLFPLAAPDASLWIGLNDAANEGQFVWISGDPVAFTYWFPGEPNDLGGEDYAAIRYFTPPAGSWWDLSGTNTAFGVVEVPPPPPPVTQPADQFMPGSARLNGQANPNGSPTLAWFEWGTSLAYGNATPPQSVGSGDNLVGFSNVLVGLVIGTEYHFRARASNAFGVTTGVDQTFNLSNQRPAVTTLAADQVTTTNARLSGQVNPRGWPTAAWFEWGTNTTYGNVIGMQDVGQGSSVSNLNVVLNGLLIGTDYHYRLVASNAFGFAAGLDQNLNLTNQRPAVTTLAADQLTTNSARLRGQVNPRGWPTAAWFEWGTDTNYGNLVGMQDVGQGSSVSNLNVVLNGLMIGPDYHYRLVATNAFGVVSGVDQTFNLSHRPPTTNTWTGADPSGYWSAPANWSPAGVPVNGNDLVFPGGLPSGDMVSTNDLTDSFFRSITFSGASRHTIRGNPITLTNRANVIINSGTNVIACDLTFAGTPSTPNYQFHSIRGFPGELTLIGNVGGGSLYVFLEQLVIRGQFTGGSLRVQYGSLVLYGDNPHAVSVEFYATSFSTLRVHGSQPNLNITRLREMESAECPSVIGDGLVGDVTGCGSITPDSTLSVKNVSGRLDIKLNGTNVGEYGRLIASGGVSLSGRLLPSAGFNPQAGQVFTIVEKTSPGPIPNAIFGPEGTVTYMNGMPLRISYVGGDGNDVTLTAEATNMGFVQIPIPGLPGVDNGSVAWGDYDNDGRLDFLLTGRTGGSPVTQVWRNTSGGFSNVTASVALGLPGVEYGSVAWGDYDNDGRLDFLLTGRTGGSTLSQVWRNTGSGFTNATASVAPGLPGVYYSCVAWGDYDNDGRLDFLLTGNGTGAGSQLWRNTGSVFSNVTVSVAPGLPYVDFGSSVAWGDYDNDGRLDFLLAGFASGSGNPYVSQVWRNTGSGFTNATASVAPGLGGIYYSSVAWGDYDNDGRLDFLLTGNGTAAGSQVWRNTGSGFVNVTGSVAPGLPRRNSVAWGDFDNDGRLDFLLTGSTNSVPPQLWRNTGGGFGNVTASVAPGLPGLYASSSAAWGDYDNDGRLDFLLTGNPGISQLWRNNMPVASNAPPTAPTGLSSTLSGGTVSLSWNPPVDDRTPSTGLNYNLRIGTTPGASDVLAPMALTDGLRLLPALGNAQAGTNAFVFNMTPGRDYYWSVQTVDTSFAGSPFAAEQQFTVAAPRIIEPLLLGNGHFQFSFSNETSVIYEVLGTTNVALPLAQWTVLGPPVSLGGGLYRFTDTLATNHAQRFYLLRQQ